MGGVGGVAVGVKDLSMLSQQHLKLRSTFVMRLYVAPKRGMLAKSGLICAAYYMMTMKTMVCVGGVLQQASAVSAMQSVMNN